LNIEHNVGRIKKILEQRGEREGEREREREPGRQYIDTERKSRGWGIE
jgi:hypothetical protein